VKKKKDGGKQGRESLIQEGIRKSYSLPKTWKAEVGAYSRKDQRVRRRLGQRVKKIGKRKKKKLNESLEGYLSCSRPANAIKQKTAGGRRSGERNSREENTTKGKGILKAGYH